MKAKKYFILGAVISMFTIVGVAQQSIYDLFINNDLTVLNDFYLTGDMSVSSGGVTVDSGDIEATAGSVTSGTSLNAGTVVKSADGSESAPSYSFTDESDMGFFRESGGSQIGVSMSGSKGACFTESASGNTNFGVGICSTSDLAPFYLYRSSTGTVAMQVENPGTTAGAGAGVTFKSGTGNTSNLLAYPTAMTIASLKDRAALRNFVGDGVSIIANEATADTRFYIGGGVDSNELMRFDDAGVVFDFDGSISPDASLAFEVTGITTQASKPAPTLTQAQRDAVSSPASGAIVYNSDSDKYNYYNGTQWLEIGSGSGSGEKNYFEGGDFESGVGLATAYEEASAPYDDGTGGSPATISVSQNSTTPLSQLADLAITKAATDGSAEGVTLLSQSIDRVDRRQVLYIKGYFDFTDSNYTSGDICLKAYDVADTAILAVVPLGGLDEDGCFNQAQGKVVSKVLTSLSTTGAVRVSLHLESDSATGSAWTAYADNVVLGPQGPVPGAIVGPWESFTPTGTWTTNATYTGWKRRVGDTLEVAVKVALGGPPTNTALILDIPDSLSIDTNKLPATFTNTTLGRATFHDNGTTIYDSGRVQYVDPTTVAVIAHGNSTVDASFTTYDQTGASVTLTWANTDELFAKFSVPIEGWKASASLSTTELYVNGSHVEASSTGQTHSSSGSWATLTIDTEAADDLNDFASNVFTAPTTAVYVMAASVVFAANATGQRGVRFYDVTNSTNLLPDAFGDASSANESVKNTTVVKRLEKGQQIRVEGYQNSSGNLGYSAYLDIKSIFDPSFFSVYGETDLVESSDLSHTFSGTDWEDVTSIELPVGEWDIVASAVSTNVGGAASDTNWGIAISQYSGTTITDHVQGKNAVFKAIANTTSGYSDALTIPRYTVILTQPTTIYLKGLKLSTATNFTLNGAYISARKIK